MSTEPSALLDQDANHEIIEIGRRIFHKLDTVKTKTFFNKDFWYAKIMDWSMQNEEFKTQMFRFVDVLPTLKSSEEVQKHLNEYFKGIKGEKGADAASIFNVGLGFGSLAPGLMAKAVKKNIEMMAKMFITGETPDAALKVLKKHRKAGIAFTVDLLGEATLSELEASDYQNRYLNLLDSLNKEANTWSHNEVTDKDGLGEIPKVNISVKLTSLYSQINEKAWDKTVSTLIERLKPIFDSAIEKKAFINIDMESYAHKDLTLAVFKEIISLPEYKDYPHFGIVIQAYLRDSFTDLSELIEFAHKRAVPFSVRLVKGAYWDYETIKANQHGWPNPVYTNKKESDANYERCTELLLKNYPAIKTALASHNVRSISAGIFMAQKLGLPKNALEIQMLYGMAEPIKLAILEMGYRVREYATVGELIPGMAYLVRRLLENTSNESFLKNKFSDDVDANILLENPAKDLKTTTGQYVTVEPFDNHPPLDFALKTVRANIETTFSEYKATLPVNVPVILSGQPNETSDIIESLNPCTKTIVASVALASIGQATKAVEEAVSFKSTWQQTSPEQRAQLLEKLAQLIDRDRYKIMAVATLEAGKTWFESDNEIIEAIDFCNYYATEMRRLSKPQKAGHIMGETSYHSYHAKGVSLVIAPWNFPFAILAGMTVASLVTGNTVIMKPAEQTSLIAYELYKLMMEAGIPKEAVQFLPGRGEEVGAFLTKHKDVDLIAFTGSKQVGLEILKTAVTIQPGQVNVKKCIIEMGGKNGLIIDNDADLDEAVEGVIYSAFGFQGQKCSAASRVVVLEEVYDRFVERLIEATKSIKVLSAENPEAYLSAVIDEEAYQKITSIIKRGKQTAKLAYQGEVPTEGYFIGPTIFTEVDPASELAQTEIFGPVLSIIKVQSINDAIDVVNSTEYALTGGIYSRSPGNIEKVKQKLEVGNLYINRSITGAIVQRHPFGGFKMSGVGSKAGGPDYLIQFMDPKVITENTMRRGFAPTDET